MCSQKILFLIFMLTIIVIYLSIFWLSSLSVNNIIVIYLMPKGSKIKLDVFINFEKLPVFFNS